MFPSRHFLYCFLLSYWWFVLIIALCGFLHIVKTRSSKWTYIAFFCVNIVQVFCKSPPLPLSGPSVELLCSPICDCSTKLYSCRLESFLTHYFFILCWLKLILFCFILEVDTPHDYFLGRSSTHFPTLFTLGHTFPYVPIIFFRFLSYKILNFSVF